MSISHTNSKLQYPLIVAQVSPTQGLLMSKLQYQSFRVSLENFGVSTPYNRVNKAGCRYNKIQFII